MSFLLALLLVASTFMGVFVGNIQAHSIVVDGDPTDWLADSSGQLENTGMYYSTGEYVWVDAVGDDVGDGDYQYPTDPFFMPGMVDIKEFRVTYDDSRIYFLIKLGNITNAWNAPEGFCGILVTIHIDQDKVPSSGQEWAAQNMDSKFDPSCWWEYVIVLHGFGSWMMNSSFNTVGWTGNGMEVAGSVDNDCIEVAVDYSVIGSFVGQIWRFMVEVGFEEYSNFREVQESADSWVPGGGVPAGDNDWVECDAFDACFYTSTINQSQDWSDYDQGTGSPTILCNIGEGFADISSLEIVSPLVYETAVVKTADRLVALQADITEDNAGNGSPDDDPDDGGWNWLIDETATGYVGTGPSSENLYGITALGILKTYKINPKPTYMTALMDVYTGVNSRPEVDSAPDFTFLVKLSQLTGNPVYAELARERYQTKISSVGDYNGDGEVNATDIAEYIRDVRHSQGYDGMIPWDINFYVQAALALDSYYSGEGYDQDAIAMADVIYQDMTGDPGYFEHPVDQWFYYYVLGLSGALQAFTSTGTHLTGSFSAEEIKNFLIENQSNDGSWNSTSYWDGTNWYWAYPDVQSTAYTVMALISYGDSASISAATKAADWLISKQNPNGGWTISSECPEVDSEVAQAIFDVIQAIGTVDVDHGSDGTIDLKTITIQQAINAAYPNDTIIVHDGTYSEALYIDKSLIIKAASKPVIKGCQSMLTNYGPRDAVIFVENAVNVVIEGFEIEGEGLGTINQKSYAVIFENASGTIKDCIISPNTIGDMHGAAVGAWDGSDLSIIFCAIKNFGRVGVFYFDGCSGGVYNTMIEGQVYSDENYVNYGIEVESWNNPCNIEVIKSEICNCDNTYPSPLWSSAGIVIDGWRLYYDLPVSTVRIIENNIHDNYYGIEVVANSLSYAHYNNFQNNREYGVIQDPDYAGNNATFDATFNWWGDPTGPYHNTTWTYKGEPYGPNYGLGDRVSDYVLYDPWLEYSWPAPPPTLKVEPIVYEAGILNKTISINVTLNDLSLGYRVVGVQFRLTYNSTLLEFLNVTEGPFLKSFASQQPGSYGTLFLYRHFEDHPLYGPSILVGILILPNGTGFWHPPFPSGNGTIATINFRVIYQERGLEKQPLTCELNLTETYILNDEGATIPSNVQNGVYKIYPTNIGDVDYDGKVDLKDYFSVAIAFGETPDRPKWNPLADINGDQKIDLKDLFTVAINFGWIQQFDP